MTILNVDIVSDVVCPWCVVGLRQLETALDQAKREAYITWHPFELNSTMPESGQNLAEHIAEKYGSTAEQSEQNRKRLQEVGESLNFKFNFSKDSRIYNTFKAHQLLHWAAEQGQQHPLKLAFFKQYFTDQLNVSDTSVLLSAVTSVGLDSEQAQTVLNTEKYSEAVRQEQQMWVSRGIQGVPAMVFNKAYMLTGAQGVENYLSVLSELE